MTPYFPDILKWIQTSCLDPNLIYLGKRTATRAGSHSFMAACRSFKCPHLGCLRSPKIEMKLIGKKNSSGDHVLP